MDGAHRVCRLKLGLVEWYERFSKHNPESTVAGSLLHVTAPFYVVKEADVARLGMGTDELEASKNSLDFDSALAIIQHLMAAQLPPSSSTGQYEMSLDEQERVRRFLDKEHIRRLFLARNHTTLASDQPLGPQRRAP